MQHKLGFYRKVNNEFCRKNELTRLEFELILFGYEYEHFNRASLVVNIPCSFSTLKNSLSYLVKNKYLRIERERAHRRSRLYSLTRKSRLMITNFYKQLFNN